jgi:hypothetical protein
MEWNDDENIKTTCVYSQEMWNLTSLTMEIKTFWTTSWMSPLNLWVGHKYNMLNLKLEDGGSQHHA